MSPLGIILFSLGLLLVVAVFARLFLGMAISAKPALQAQLPSFIHGKITPGVVYFTVGGIFVGSILLFLGMMS